MKVESLKEFLVSNKEELTKAILCRDYRPNPVRRVKIPKIIRQAKLLSIPTVVDRVIQ